MSYLDELFSLQDKTAVVIGGTGELCGTMAIALARSGQCDILVNGAGINASTIKIKWILK